MKAALLLLLILPACSCARRIPARGMVLQIDPARQTVLISHQEIPAYMSAMVMPFRARGSGELAGLYPGAQIDFQLVVRRGRSHIERIRLRGVPPDGVVEDQGDRFRIPVPPNKIAVGEVVPDFRLTDQAGRPVRLSDFRGKVVAVDFIYTRCPLPEVCPRLSANFARLQERFADLVLLSITLDPDHDTPEELARYARIWKARLPRWRFLTGSHEAVRTVAGAFGLSYWAEEGLITHTSQTGVVARDGKLAARVDGSSYRVGQLGDLIEKEMEKK